MLFKRSKQRTLLSGKEVAAGLNEAAGLKSSSLLKKNLPNHELSNDEYDALLEKLDAYHKPDGIPKKNNFDIMQCDYTSVRIAQIYYESDFSFTIEYLSRLHKIIFTDVLKSAGSFRDNSEPEVIVPREIHVFYTTPEEIIPELSDLFAVHYNLISKLTNIENINDTVKSLASFTVRLWQTHPFIMGNTRVIVLFLIKLLQTTGHGEGIRPFWEHAVSFRDALIMANPDAEAPGVEVITRPLEVFFRHVLTDAKK